MTKYLRIGVLTILSFLTQQTLSSTLPLTCTGEIGLLGQYFDEFLFKDSVAVEVTNTFYIDVGPGKIHPNMNGADLFSASFSGIFRPPASGIYTFESQSDDAGRLSIDGVRVAGIYGIQNYPLGKSSSPPMRLEAGQPYLLTYDYNEDRGLSTFNIRYKFGSGPFQNLSNVEVCHYVPESVDNFDCSTHPPGLMAYYYNKNDFTEYVTSRTDKPFNNNQWIFTGENLILPSEITNSSDFGVIWKGTLSTSLSGLYRIVTEGKEFVEIILSGQTILRNSQEGFPRLSTPFQTEAGKHYPILMKWSSNPQSNPHSLAFRLQKVIETEFYSPIFSGVNFRACFPPHVVAPIRSSMTFSTAAEIPVTLNSQPTQDVYVKVITSGSIKATPCTLIFTPSNWDIPQIVYSQTPVVLGEALVFNPTSKDPRYNNTLAGAKTWVYGQPETCNSFTLGATCSSWGDPHMITFDGLHFDNHVNEDVYLVRHVTSEFVVQSRQAPCGAGHVSCSYAIAIKYQEAIITVFISSLGGIPTITYNTAAQNLGGLTSKVVGNDYSFTFPNLAQVSVSSTWWGTGKTYYLSTYITVPTSYQTKLRGLCGTYDQNPTNDYHKMDGSPATQAESFQDWIVPPSERLINGKDVIPPLSSFPEDICSLSACGTSPPLPPPCTTGCTPTPPQPPPPPCSYPLEQAQLVCRTYFVTSVYAMACASIGVNTTAWYLTCVQEVVDMCGEESIPPQACAFQLACSLAPVPQCSCLCNLRGDCTASGCSCYPPNDGETCENNPDSIPCATSVSPRSGRSGKVVTVYVADLPSESEVLQCQIDGVVVPATKVTENSVKCTIPFGILWDREYEVTVLSNGQGTNCGALFNVSRPHGRIDPHFAGFNGEKMEVKRDSNAANQLFHLYCSESITITTLFYEYEDKLLFMTKFWVKLGETLFTLNLSPKPKILTAHEDPIYLEELGRYRVTIPDGHLEWDDSKLRVVYKYLLINFSTHVYLQGSPYMNIDFGLKSNNLESPVTGIVGRTLHNTLTTEEFESYLQFKAPVQDVISFTCSVPNDSI